MNENENREETGPLPAAFMTESANSDPKPTDSNPAVPVPSVRSAARQLPAVPPTSSH